MPDVRPRRFATLALSVAVGCGPVVALDDGPISDDTTTGDASTSVDLPWPTAPSPDGSGPPPDPTTTTDDPPSTFVENPDGGTADPDCDLFAQDCPPGQKCTVWANDGGSAWNATRCVDIAPDPAQVNEPCMVEGSGVSGQDDCDLGMMCWSVDETGEGHCVEFCRGNADAPTCPEMHRCSQSSAGVLSLCLPICDPLAPSCPPDQACYPINDAFSCAPDASGDLGAHGDPCRFINSCDPGLICVGAAAHSACPSNGCCSTVCNHLDPMSDVLCASLDPAQECFPWFVEGMAPPEYEHVGVCALPQE